MDYKYHSKDTHLGCEIQWQLELFGLLILKGEMVTLIALCSIKFKVY